MRAGPCDRPTHSALRMVALTKEGQKLMSFLDDDIVRLQEKLETETDIPQMRRIQGAIKYARTLREEFDQKEQARK